MNNHINELKTYEEKENWKLIIITGDLNLENTRWKIVHSTNEQKKTKLLGIM